MEEKFFAGLHAGFLVHRLSRMAGTEVLDTSPAHWKVTAIDDACVECINVTVQPLTVHGAAFGRLHGTPCHDHVTGAESLSCWDGVRDGVSHQQPLKGSEPRRAHRDATPARKGERRLEAHARLAGMLAPQESATAAGGVGQRLKPISYALR